MEQDDIPAPSMDREVTYNLAEHEILLSFVDDFHAEMFGYWFNSKGFKLFASWYIKNKEKYS